MLKEFKEFAVKGNVMDMAIGIIIGAAFGTIVKSLVDDIIMPVVGLVLGNVDFTNIFLTLSGDTYPTLEQARQAGAVTVNVGVFLNAVIAFLIVAWAMFFVVKGMNTLKRKAEEESAEAPAPPRSEVLLAEIRDLLRAR
jgi:large conductance mechanosensitive channel